MSKAEDLKKLNDEMSACSKCILHCGASRVVVGDGNPEAEIMFIGEAPGKKENELGIPFIGSSGKILDKMLLGIELNREDVYLTNICKCRPPENRDPFPEEIKNCLPWLTREIEIIQPKLIITLGKFALNCFIPEVRISETHGKLHEIYLDKISVIKIYPLHHPAAARINRKTRALFENDFHKIPSVLVRIKK